MCFYHGDADWSASVVHETRPTAAKAVACDECGRRILPGETYAHVYMQERETCRNCEFDDESDDPEDLPAKDDAEPCPDGECDFGETFDYDCCLDCGRVLEAIRAVELGRGCREAESQPGYTGLWEAMREADEDGAYAAKALEMFPALRSHLWRLTGDPEPVGVVGEFGEPVGVVGEFGEPVGVVGEFGEPVG